MKIEKNKLVKVNYISEEFIGKFFIKNVEGLILNTIRVYGYMHNSIDKNDINIITTITPGTHYDRYILKAMRVISADVIKIDADDYLEIGTDMNGNYEFVLKDDVEADAN
jgi:hypothetical protein